jgi:type II secretory pathway component PulK
MKRAHSSSSRARGSILIVVLWASIGLVSVALLFGHSMVMAYRGSDNDLAGRQAEQAIEGGIRYAESILAAQETHGLFPDVTSYEGEALAVGEATFWLLGRPADTTNNGATREWGLVDEASKINLNTATKEMLINLGIADDLAAAIVDWGKTDGSGSGSGGVTGTEVKHAPFESVEELALVPGMTREILYGEDANLNGVLDPAEDDGDHSPPADNSDGKLDPGIFEYLTVFTSEPNTNSAGEHRANVNDREALSQVLRNQLPDRAQAILASFPPSKQFGSVLELKIVGNMQDEEFAKVAYELTTQPNPKTLEGLINVNTASEAVLACIPGIDPNMAADIVSQRLNRTATDPDYGWVTTVLGEAGARAAGRYLTGRTYQVSADVAAVGRHGRGYRRARAVIDLTKDTPRVIYRRDLSPLGWALGREVREDLALKKEVR